jgi:hypothetical protein
MARLVSLVVVASTLVSPVARAERAVSTTLAQMWLFLAPEEHVCAAPTSTWHDPSDPLFFATGPTARLDAHELWAGGLASASLVSARYEEGALRLLVLGTTKTRIEINRPGPRSRWPFC